MSDERRRGIGTNTDDGRFRRICSVGLCSAEVISGNTSGESSGGELEKGSQFGKLLRPGFS